MAELGQQLIALVTKLYPILRSITGDGVRETLRILSEVAPLQISEVPSGSPALDWTVPPEWNVREAWVRGPDGAKVIDVANHSLHLLNYSVPMRAKLPLAELKKHLFSLPDRPDWIPYRTSYYSPAWGFCLSHRQLESLPEGEYEVCIDSTLAPGSLTYGEILVPGETDEEILISSHVCHPSLADDNLSGMSIAAHLARKLASQPRRRYAVRFVFAPGTIGALTWLERNKERAPRIKHGLTLTCLGDSQPFTYKRTFAGDNEIDLAAEHVLGKSGQFINFFPYGYDERQYNSPGFRLAVGSLMRGRHGMFPEYHTSGDDLSFVSAERLEESFGVLSSIIDVLQGNARYKNLAPYGEPQLGKRGLYGAMGGMNLPDLQLALLWVLSASDGEHSLLEIARKSGIAFASLRAAADLLLKANLLS